MAANFDVAHAHIRMAQMVDRIFEAVPDVAVIVSTLLPNANPATQANILIYNKNLVGVVAQRAAAGKKIALVDLSSDWFSLSDILGDGTHPTEVGYLKIAKVFYNGIVGMGAQISAPLSVAGVDDLAAKDDPGAGTAFDTICHTTPGQLVPAAQRAECGSWSSTPNSSGEGSKASQRLLFRRSHLSSHLTRLIHPTPITGRISVYVFRPANSHPLDAEGFLPPILKLRPDLNRRNACLMLLFW